MHTLNSIQNEIGINRGQLAKVADDLGIATGRGITISDEDRDRLVAEAKRRSEARVQALIQANTPKATESEAEPAGQLQVIQPPQSNLAAPKVPDSVDLSLFGFEPIEMFEDPELVADSLIQVLDKAEQGFELYLESLEAKTKTTKTAAQKLKDRRSKFERNMDKAEVLARVSRDRLIEAQAALNEEAKELAGKQSAAA